MTLLGYAILCLFMSIPILAICYLIKKYYSWVCEAFEEGKMSLAVIFTGAIAWTVVSVIHFSVEFIGFILTHEPR